MSAVHEAIVVWTLWTLSPYVSAVADLGGSKSSLEPPFGFSFDKKLGKPGLQQNPTI